MGSLQRKRMNFNILYFFIPEIKYWMIYNLNDMSNVLLLSFIEFTQLVILTLVYVLQLTKIVEKEDLHP